MQSIPYYFKCLCVHIIFQIRAVLLIYIIRRLLIVGKNNYEYCPLLYTK
jgi:hypothetical protein